MTWCFLDYDAGVLELSGPWIELHLRFGEQPLAYWLDDEGRWLGRRRRHRVSDRH